MLIPQQAQGGSLRTQGGDRCELAELRRQLADPSTLSDGNRRRLLELARRVARVQALGDEFRRVGLSEMAVAAMVPACAPAGARGPAAVA